MPSGPSACPLCGSPALSWADGGDVDGFHTRYLLRCGECGTWRRVVLDPRAARALERRWRRDRRQIAVAVECIERAGAELEIRGPAMVPRVVDA